MADVVPRELLVSTVNSSEQSVKQSGKGGGGAAEGCAGLAADDDVGVPAKIAALLEMLQGNPPGDQVHLNQK